MKHNFTAKKYSFFFVLFYIFCTTSTSFAQQTGCLNDFDCDGIIDALDVDDDNDGIYDHVESPNCFYLDKKVHETGDRGAFWDVTTTVSYRSGSPDLLIDGTTQGMSIPIRTAITNEEIFRLSFKPLSTIEFSEIILRFDASGFFSTTTRVILQGSQDGIDWSDLTERIVPLSHASVPISVTKNQGPYRVYRVLGVQGIAANAAGRTLTEVTAIVGGSYMPSLFPKPNCVDEDNDNDGMPNHQDFDGDGDGGSDVLEVGFSDDDKDGMLGISPVTVNQFGAVTSATGYSLPTAYYKIAAVNATVDSDGDGVADMYDIDDDNDGIYDHFESPSCFYFKTAYETGQRHDVLNVSTDLVYTTGNPDMLIDGLTTTGILIPVGTALTNKVIVSLSTKLTSGVELSSLSLHFSTGNVFTSAKVVLQGTKDGVVWEDLTEILTPSTAAVVYIPITKNQDTYGKYRLLGTAGTTKEVSINEITTTIGKHMSSLFPKLNCDNEDIDRDGKPNHQDLDTDGNGAYDVIEAGFEDEDHDGIFGISPVTVNQFGEVLSNRGNVIPLGFYKTAAFDLRKDFDGDGVVDLFDVDDDNDGIYDHIESPNCFYINPSFYEFGDRRELLDVSTTLPFIGGDQNLVIDGYNTDLSGIRIGAVTPLTGQEIIRLTTKLAKGIEYKSISCAFNATAFFTTSSRILIQGSQDGNTWTDLSDVLTPPTTAVVTMNITKNQGEYRIYRLLGMGGTTGTADKIITEVTANVGTFMPSLYPKINCIGEDVDNDGKPNHQDLNSDGDTCNDVIEAGFLDLDRDGILGTSPVTVDQYGRVITETGYTVPNNLYFLDATKNFCTGLGIPIDENAHCVDMDNMTNDAKLVQSGFHTSIARTKTGFSIFGVGARPTAEGGSLLIPTDIVPAKGFTYGGTIIDATIGGTQFFVLATEGLYTWGISGRGIPASWSTVRGFQKIDLPKNLAPNAIKFISSSFTNLVLLTKSGDVYIAAGSNNKEFGAYGDGSTAYDELWHKSNISHVISIKVNSAGQAFALTNSGDLYVWGRGVIVGDGSPAQDLLNPTKIDLPLGVTKVKMIATSSSAIYVLGDDKRIYATGINTYGQLGIGNTTTQLSWQTVKDPTRSAYLENVKFINATIHDGYDAAASAIDESGMAYLWGDNSGNKLGATIQLLNIQLPRIPNGLRPGVHDILYAEPGGHVSPIVDKKTGKFGYVGHKVNGSMGDGTTIETFIESYNFVNTPDIDFCGIVLGGAKMTRVMVNPMNINTKPRR